VWMRRAPCIRISSILVLAIASGVAAADAAPAGQMRGTILFGRHDPAPGAVIAVRPDGAPTPVWIATSGEDGTFGFDRMVDGAYRVEVRRDGYEPVVQTGIAVRSPFRAIVEVVLHRGPSPAAPVVNREAGTASLTGTVRLAGGGGVAEAQVRLVRADGGADPEVARTTADGGFAFEGLRAGTWRLQVIGAGLLPLRASIDLTGTVDLDAQLAPQPADYEPSAEDLIVPEDVIPPAGS
jgi:Carboxypeptidase regulatory-like domain